MLNIQVQHLPPGWSSGVTGRTLGLAASLDADSARRMTRSTIAEPLQATDIDLIAARSARIGVPAKIEVTPVTHAGSRAALPAFGFGPDADAGTRVHVYSLDRAPTQRPRHSIHLAHVSERSLEEWQAVSAAGWGHDTADARRAADAFARAAHTVDGDGMIIALDADDGRPLGSASLTTTTRWQQSRLPKKVTDA